MRPMFWKESRSSPLLTMKNSNLSADGGRINLLFPEEQKDLNSLSSSFHLSTSYFYRFSDSNIIVLDVRI